MRKKIEKWKTEQKKTLKFNVEANCSFKIFAIEQKNCKLAEKMRRKQLSRRNYFSTFEKKYNNEDKFLWNHHYFDKNMPRKKIIANK